MVDSAEHGFVYIGDEEAETFVPSAASSHNPQDMLEPFWEEYAEISDEEWSSGSDEDGFGHVSNEWRGVWVHSFRFFPILV